VNGESIERLAREAGFEIVFPEDLSFAEQVTLLRSARVVVMPEGSALFLAMFVTPGTTVCILSHPLTDLLADYEALLSPHGIRVMAVTGPIAHFKTSSPNDSDYTIDEAIVRRTIEGLVSGVSG
jgi:capsular polysaccharide biosynthesis protein